MTRILEFPSFKQPLLRSLEGSANLEFLRIKSRIPRDCFGRFAPSQ
ncbi:MAG: hypothetical protein PUI01_05165 [Campylobacteraceae bacterium]|nr:hypothetical protein [Campylobacteraceae bacterium]